MKLDAQSEAELIRRGAKVTYTKPISATFGEAYVPEPAKPILVEPGVATMMDSRAGESKSLVAFVPVATTSEINGRAWKARNRRTGAAWQAVSKTFGPHLSMLAPFAAAYHRNEALCVKFVRLGGRRLDTSNLPTATKAVEDALAFLMGANDGDPRWRASFEQEPGGPVGVRIDLSLFPS